MEIVMRSSMLRDYENIECALQYKARWFPENDQERELMSLDNVQAIRWGQYFEQLVLGSGVDGKTITLRDDEIRSVHYKRIREQAETARKYIFRDLGLKFIASQLRLESSIEVDGVTFRIEGHIDGLSGDDNGVPKLVLDTKYTGDSKNEFGPYAWGNPENMDMIQMVTYEYLVRANYEGVTDLENMYYVADSKADTNVLVVTPVFSEVYISACFQRYKEAFLGTSQMLHFNKFPANPEFNRCKACPLKDICEYRANVPEKTIIYK